MITHIALFSWSDAVPAGHAERCTRELRQFASTLGGLVSYTCGPDAGLTEGAADFAVVAVFEDEAAWHEYDTADEHQRIRSELFRPYITTRTVTQVLS